MVILICMNGTDGVDTLLMISEENRFFLLNHTYVILQLVRVKKHSICHGMQITDAFRLDDPDQNL